MKKLSNPTQYSVVEGNATTYSIRYNHRGYSLVPFIAVTWYKVYTGRGC